MNVTLKRFGYPASIVKEFEHGRSYGDIAYPKPPDVLQGLEIDSATLERWRTLVTAHWICAPPMTLSIPP